MKKYLGYLVLSTLMIGSVFTIAIFISPIFSNSIIPESQTAAILQSFNQAEIQNIKTVSEEIISLNTNFKNQTGTVKTATLATLKNKVIDRKTKLLKLMEDNPSGALSSFFTSSQIKSLPAEIQENTEKLVSGNFTLNVLHEDNFTDGTAKYFYHLDQGKKSYNFYPVGILPNISSGSTVQVSGYQLENDIVASVQASSLKILRKPTLALTTPTSLKIAIIPVRYNDTSPSEITKEQITRRIFNGGPVAEFYKKNSYNPKFSIEGDIFNEYILNEPSINPGRNCESLILSRYLRDEQDLNKIFLDLNISPEKYTNFLFVVNINCPFDQVHGRGLLGTRNFNGQPKYFAWVTDPRNLSNINNLNTQSSFFEWSEFDNLVSHELGHNFGLYHGSGQICPDGEDPLYGLGCIFDEYGNFFDVMGTGLRISNSRGANHFNVFAKEHLGWLNSDSITSIRTSGLYTIKPLENILGKRGAKIFLPEDTSLNPSFYLEYRRPKDYDSQIFGGGENNPKLGLTILKTTLIGGPTPTRFLKPTTDNTIFNLTPGTKFFCDSRRRLQIGPVSSADANGITFAVKFNTDCKVSPQTGGDERPFPISNPNESPDYLPSSSNFGAIFLTGLSSAKETLDFSGNLRNLRDGDPIFLMALIHNDGRSPRDEDTNPVAVKYNLTGAQSVTRPNNITQSTSRRNLCSQNSNSVILRGGRNCFLVFYLGNFKEGMEFKNTPVTINLDPENNIQESIETNNAKTVTLSIPVFPEARPIEGRPIIFTDLSVSELSIQPSPVFRNVKSLFKARVSNLGTIRVDGITPDLNFGSFASSVDVSPPLQNQCPRAPFSLEANSSCIIAVNVTYNTPTDTQATNADIKVTLDPANVINEGNETNNTETLNFNIFKPTTTTILSFPTIEEVINSVIAPLTQPTQTTPTPINGVLGTANGKTYSSGTTSYGSDKQCLSGNSSNTAFPSAGGSTNWICNGISGGTNSSTGTASRAAVVVVPAPSSTPPPPSIICSQFLNRDTCEANISCSWNNGCFNQISGIFIDEKTNLASAINNLSKINEIVKRVWLFLWSW